MAYGNVGGLRAISLTERGSVSRSNLASQNTAEIYWSILLLGPLLRLTEPRSETGWAAEWSQRGFVAKPRFGPLTV